MSSQVYELNQSNPAAAEMTDKALDDRTYLS